MSDWMTKQEQKLVEAEAVRALEAGIDAEWHLDRMPDEYWEALMAVEPDNDGEER